jgi:hypothetical protein
MPLNIQSPDVPSRNQSTAAKPNFNENGFHPALALAKKFPQAKFNWKDPLLLEELLTEDEILIRDSFR